MNQVLCYGLPYPATPTKQAQVLHPNRFPFNPASPVAWNIHHVTEWWL